MDRRTNAQVVEDFVNEPTQTGSTEARVQLMVRVAVTEAVNHLSRLNFNPQADGSVAETYVQSAEIVSGLRAKVIWDAAFAEAREKGVLED